MIAKEFEAASLTVRLERIAGNYAVLRGLAGSAGVAAVVKADGYGLGANMVASTLRGEGCDTFFVARLQEGIALRQALPEARIFVFDGAEPDAAPALIAHRLIPVLNSLPQIAAWSAAAKASRRTLDAAIHIDTGMNRLGVAQGELSLLAAEWKTRLAGLKPVLWMSHLACSAEPENPMNAAQLNRFRAALAILPPAPASLAASGGVLLGRDYLFDLARPGLALYGAHPQPPMGGKGTKNPFKTTAFLTARLLQLRRAEPGETVGYGATFTVSKPCLLATIGLGYADGVSRALSNRGIAHVGGKRVKMVGRVSMDLTVLDVTGVEEARLGDEVELLGDHISLEEVAEAAGTISYEILTSLRLRVPHRYTDDA
ncbi:MAG TPA: alanine racemase [Rhizomicrobium sp.]|nr:alanine racemase [Rhizomicrobium sp.]